MRFIKSDFLSENVRKGSTENTFLRSKASNALKVGVLGEETGKRQSSTPSCV